MGRDQGLYGIAYSTRDGRQEDQLIGTKAEAEAEKSELSVRGSVRPGRVAQGAILTGARMRTQLRNVPWIDRLWVLYLVVVQHLRLRHAGHALLAQALTRDVVFYRPPVIASGADFAFGEEVGHGVLRYRGNAP